MVHSNLLPNSTTQKEQISWMTTHSLLMYPNSVETVELCLEDQIKS